MKKLMIAIAMMMSTATMAQDVKLPKPDMKQEAMTVVEALQTRHSVRSYMDKDLTMQQISNICWAACGQSRGEKFITAPSAMNRQEIRLFVFTKKGAYEYLAQENMLRHVADGDHRKLIAGQQDFVMQAPVSLVMVIDFEKFGSQNERAVMMGCVDAGNVSENINLYCQSVGLATVPRASMDSQEISKLLKLTDKQMPIMNNPVGYEKK